MTVIWRWRVGLRLFSIAGMTGLITSLTFTFLQHLLTRDQEFELWELALILIGLALPTYVLALITKINVAKLMIISYLTFFMPILGVNFGASGSEPMWQFGLLGLIGGLFWSIPFTLQTLIRKT